MKTKVIILTILTFLLANGIAFAEKEQNSKAVSLSFQMEGEAGSASLNIFNLAGNQNGMVWEIRCDRRNISKL